MAAAPQGIFPRNGVPAEQAAPGAQEGVESTCDSLFYAARCTPRIDIQSLNAIISEIVNLVNCSGLEYDCSRLDNLCQAVQASVNGLCEKVESGEAEDTDYIIVCRENEGIIKVSFETMAEGLGYAFYERPEDLRDIAINDLPAGGVVAPFPKTITEEFNQVFSGGNSSGDLPNLASEDYGRILFMMPSEERTNYVGADTPWMSIRGKQRRFIPVDVRTQIPGLSVAEPLFEPIRTNLFGWLAWRYLGDELLYTTLEGSISTFVKTSLQTDESYLRSTLSLEAWDVPAIALGQGGGRQNLAVSSTGFTLPAPLVDTLEFQDLGGPINTQTKSTANMNPDLIPGTGAARFISGTFSETTNTAVDTIDPATDVTYGGGTVRQIVTPWMTIGTGVDIPRERMFMLLNTGGLANLGQYSTFGRVQYKLVNGDIKYLQQQSVNRSAFRGYVLPRDAVQVRIALDVFQPTGMTDAQLGGFLRFSSLTQLVSAVQSPLHGLWQKADFAVCQDVVFYPGASYALIFNNIIYDGAFNRANGFRYQGGGLSAAFPAGEMKKRIARRFYNRGS